MDESYHTLVSLFLINGKERNDFCISFIHHTHQAFISRFLIFSSEGEGVDDSLSLSSQFKEGGTHSFPDRDVFNMYNNFWLEYWNLDHFLSTLTDSFLLNSIVSSLFHLPLFSTTDTLFSLKKEIEINSFKTKEVHDWLESNNYTITHLDEERSVEKEEILWTEHEWKGRGLKEVKETQNWRWRERSNRESQKRGKKKEKGKDGKQWLDLQPANNLFFRTNESEREKRMKRKQSWERDLGASSQRNYWKKSIDERAQHKWKKEMKK